MIEFPKPNLLFFLNDDKQWQAIHTEWEIINPQVFGYTGFTKDQLRTCIEQAAAEAREQMREECIAVCNRYAEKLSGHVDTQLKNRAAETAVYHTAGGAGVAKRITAAIKELK